MLALFKVLNVSSYQSEDSHKCLLILDVSELHSRLLKLTCFDFTASKWKVKPESSQYQCQNGAVVAQDEAHTVDCLQIRSEERATEKGSQEVRSAEPNRRPPSSSSSSSKPSVGESKDLLHSSTGGPESSTTPENLPQEEHGSKATRAAKNSSPKVRRSSSNTPSPPAGRTEKKHRSSSKTVSPNRDAAEKIATAAQSYHTEQTSK